MRPGSFIKRNGAGQWQYTREWDLPDMWAFTTALNLSASQLPHPSGDLVPVDECKPLFEWGTGEMNWSAGLGLEPSTGRWSLWSATHAVGPHTGTGSPPRRETS